MVNWREKGAKGKESQDFGQEGSGLIQEMGKRSKEGNEKGHIISEASTR